MIDEKLHRDVATARD